ncbi:MAG: sulfotransferase [Anderseniella sp.]|jgi:hypothetical protein|nr:sulfotransferase [Anderseniella sp.]
MKELVKSVTPPWIKTPARKVLNAQRKASRRIASARFRLTHAILRLKRGQKQQHLVVLGFARSGATMLFSMISSTIQDTVTMKKEVSAGQTRHMYHPRICTERPRDVFDILDIEKTMPFRDFKIVCVVRDPRDLVSSKQDLTVPFQYFQGMDYLMFREGNVLSYSDPGISAMYERIRQLLGRDNVLLVRYEDILSDPEAVKDQIAAFSGFSFEGRFSDFHTKKISTPLEEALNGSRPVEEKDVPGWMKPERLERAMQQLKMYPEMEDMIAQLGYQPTTEMLDEAGIRAPEVTIWDKGHIVAFHTPDPLYTQEAARFRARLDTLGLASDITVVPPRKDWVENCAIKPSIIQDARHRLTGPLLYLDVDAYVHKNPWPMLSQHQDCDIGAYINPNGKLLSGTILINDTPGARDLLDEWVRRQTDQQSTWDQKVLQEIILEDEARPISERLYRFHRLTPCMTYIFDGQGTDYLYEGPIVEHLQASREVKMAGSPLLAHRQERLKELFRT